MIAISIEQVTKKFGQIVASTQGQAGVPTPLAGLVGVGSFNDSAWFDDIAIESPDLPDDSDSSGDDTAVTSAGDEAVDSDDASADAATVGDADTTMADTTTAPQTESSDGCGCAADRHRLAPAFAVFLMVKLVNRLREQEADKPAEEAPAPTPTEALLIEIRDELRNARRAD